MILIGRGLDLKEELELRKRKRKVVARKFEVNFHCAVFRVWKVNPQPNKDFR